MVATGPNKAEKDALLSTALGVTVEEVQAAFGSVRTTRGSRGDCPKGNPAADASTGTTSL